MGSWPLIVVCLALGYGFGFWRGCKRASVATSLVVSAVEKALDDSKLEAARRPNLIQDAGKAPAPRPSLSETTRG